MFFQWIIFALVYLILNRLVFRPILRTLSLRSAKTAGLAADAEQLAARAATHLQKYEAQLAAAKVVALSEKDELVRQGLKEKEMILKEAKGAWDETIRQIRAQITSELKTTALSIKGEITLLAKSITEKVLA